MREFVGYEYKEVPTDMGQMSFLIDSYANFGWEVDENINGGTPEGYLKKAGVSHHKKVVVRLKRDRKIMNKMELTRLQRNFAACVEEIWQLEKEKTSIPTAQALTVGFLGTVFMAGATFAVTADPPHVMLCVVLAVPGFLGWIAPYFVYKRRARRQTEKINPLIEEKYDEIYEICEKGNKLLN